MMSDEPKKPILYLRGLPLKLQDKVLKAVVKWAKVLEKLHERGEAE